MSYKVNYYTLAILKDGTIGNILQYRGHVFTDLPIEKIPSSLDEMLGKGDKHKYVGVIENIEDVGGQCLSPDARPSHNPSHNGWPKLVGMFDEMPDLATHFVEYVHGQLIAHVCNGLGDTPACLWMDTHDPPFAGDQFLCFSDGNDMVAWWVAQAPAYEPCKHN